MTRLHDGEPPIGSERVVSIASLLARLRRHEPPTGPFVLAVDGRSSNGKTTLAARLSAATPGGAVVHTDDVAWHHSAFDWVDLLVTGVLEPLRRGEAADYRPPAWDARGRPGAITVPAGADLVVVEGVGAGRAALADLVDAVVWVQSDLDVTDERNRVRVEAGEIDPAGYASWMAEEVPFQAREQTWMRADAVVAGTPALPYDAEREVVVLRW